MIKEVHDLSLCFLKDELPFISELYPEVRHIIYREENSVLNL
jgi:hypothetical protein